MNCATAIEWPMGREGEISIKGSLKTVSRFNFRVRRFWGGGCSPMVPTSTGKDVAVRVLSEAASLDVEVWPIERVIPYDRNARKIPQQAIDKVAASIKEFGWRQPI